MVGKVPAKPQSGLPGRYPFRLAASRQSTFPKGTASVVAGKFLASPKGVPLGELSPQATEGVFPSSPSQSKPCGFDSSPKGRALGMAVQFPAKPQSGLPGSTPSVIACGDATFPKGTASVVAVKFPV